MQTARSQTYRASTSHRRGGQEELKSIAEEQPPDCEHLSLSATTGPAYLARSQVKGEGGGRSRREACTRETYRRWGR